MANLTKKQIANELWSRGNLYWKLHDGQKKVYDSIKSASHKLYVVNCSRQFGKSYLTALMAIETALQTPNAQIRYGAAYKTEVSQFIIPAFDKLLEDCPEALRPKFLWHKNTYVFPNRSEIRIVGLDKNPNGLRGNTLDFIILDECAFVKNLDYVYKSVIIPATTHRPDAKILMISTPPVSPAHPFVKYCQEAKVEGRYSEFDIYQNPMLNEFQIDKLAEEVGGKNTTAWKREFLCQFVVESTLAIIPEWDKKFVAEPNKNTKYPLWHKYVAMDIGFVDLTVVLYAHYNFEEARLYVEKEFVINGPEMTTDHLANVIKSHEKGLWGDQKAYRRIADNNNLVLLNDLSVLHDIQFYPTDKEALEAMVNQVRLWVKDGRVSVSSTCPQLLGSLEFGIWDSRRKKFDRSEFYGHFDALAALVYLIRNVDSATNPVPYDFGRSKNDIFSINKPKISGNAQILKEAFSVRGKFDK
jgi:hypothetical protein